MSVLVVTSLGDIVIDLFADRCPLTCKNFLKLCKIKYYNGCLFHTVQKDFTAQTGDPTGMGTGGDSIYKFLYGDQARFFGDEIHLDIKHSKTGTVAMVSAGENLNASQFYLTLRDDLDYLDEKHTVFGEVAEGLETLARINEAYVDEKGRPYKNVRIKHTYILDDPFDDPSQLAELIPQASPEGKPKDEVDDDVRLEDDWVPMDEQVGAAELDEIIHSKEAHSSAVVLEAIGDIPEAEIKPPDNVLFVCKLNPVTEDEDLHTIFSRFGTVVSADVIRDFKTGDSLCYAFIEFETQASCEQAYFKMDNVLIDDRRIHVDFSQSVAKKWSQFRQRKDHQMGKGRGCFKCGGLDHISKDCTGASMNQQPSKYILKDENAQRGGNDNSRYDMVFDEGTPGSAQARDQKPESGVEKKNVKRPSSIEVSKYDGYDKRGSNGWHRQSDKRRRYREDEQHPRRNDRERLMEKGNEYEDKKDNNDRLKKSFDADRHRDRKDDWDCRKRHVDNYGHRDKRDERELRERDKEDSSSRRNADDNEFPKRRHRGDRRR